nr:hypothetical protein [Tanacetum cinerariifolium]
MVNMVPHEAFACSCAEGDVVLRQSYKPESYGEDTRKTFVDHLYTALDQRLIRTYKDDVTLPRGESVGPTLLKAIQESRHAVIIFSKNYADSSWCLDEIVHIMKCRAENGLIVMPVFYDVDPSDSWKKALVDASNISGWEPKNVANGHESMVIKRIVDTIFGGLFPLSSDIDEGLVGMKARLQDLISQLEMGSPLYKTKIEVYSVAEGKRKIKSMLCHSNVLVILDDVDDLVQLEALAGSRDWFGDGSRIIITTRDEHLLEKHKVDHVFPVRLLSDDEAIELFNIHAYNEEKHIKDYEKLSLQVVSYADGLPLALKVLGSFLYDKDAKEWTSTMDRLRDIPQSKIVDKLKINYDGLEPFEKELFLDIACFFRGKLKSETMDKNLRWLHLIGDKGRYYYSDIACFFQIEAIEFGDNRMDLPYTDKIMLISKMKNLRWLHLIGDKGRYYPASPFPDTFQATNLVFF